MNKEIDIVKGIHPGIVLERELKRRKLSKRKFASSIKEYPQTIGSITKGKRKMNTALSLKIENALGLEEGTLMILQVYYDIKIEKKNQSIDKRPDLSLLRPSLFWDTTMDKIDWDFHKDSVIKRVFERGNKQEKDEILRFYGHEAFKEIFTKQELNKIHSIPEKDKN